MRQCQLLHLGAMTGKLRVALAAGWMGGGALGIIARNAVKM